MMSDNDDIEKPKNAIEAMDFIDSVVGQDNTFEGIAELLFRVEHREPNVGEWSIILLADDVFYFAKRVSRIHYESGMLKVRANTVQDVVTLKEAPGEVSTNET